MRWSWRSHFCVKWSSTVWKKTPWHRTAKGVLNSCFAPNSCVHTQCFVNSHHVLEKTGRTSAISFAMGTNKDILLWWSHQKGPGAAKSTQSYQLGFFGLVDPISVTFHFFYLRPAWTIYHSGHCKTFFCLKAPKQSSVSLLPSLFKGWTFFLSVNSLMDVELDWGQSISHYCHYPASMKVWFRCRVSAVDQAIPENRELKKIIKFSFFRQTSIVDKFWHFCSHLQSD